MAKKQNVRPTPQAPKPAPRPAQPQAAPQQRVPKEGMSLVKKLCILLGIIAGLVYANTMQNGFVLDDVMVIKENRMVKAGFAGIGDLLTTPHLRGHIQLSTDTYRPLSLVMFAIEHQLFGENPAVGHFFNILLFAGCVIALFVFLNKLFDGKRIAFAFVAALFFALHPIHTEVVANIKSRDELLCFFFAFLSLNVFINYMRDGKILQLILGSFYLYLAFISKETVITFVGIIPLVFFFYRNESKQRAIMITAGTIVAAGIFLGLREGILNEYHANAPYEVKFLDNFLAGTHGATRLATAILLMGEYFKLMFIPYPIVCDHSYNSTPFVGFGNIWAMLSLLIYLGLGALAIYRLFKFKKDPWAFGILFYLITISLFSNIAFLVGAALADRFAFFASAGTCMLLALAIEKWVLRTEAAEIGQLTTSKAMAAIIPIGLIYGAMTIDRNADWKDNFTLYSTDVKKSPNNTRLYYYMGAELQKKYDEAPDAAGKEAIVNEGLKNLKRSLEIYPDNVDSHAEIGATYFRAKNYDSAVKHLKRALEMNPRQINASTNLGTVYLTQNRFAEALPYYKLTVNVNPGHVLALFNLAVCYVQTQKYDSSIYYFKRTIEIEPTYLNHKATEYTGMVYKMAGKMDSALHYEALARQFNPGFRLQ
ncbi:MAG: tetratricopeptide repeat protein [Bacteroidota bacterium]